MRSSDPRRSPWPSAGKNETRLLAIDDDEVIAILAVMDDPPDGLEDLRATLLQEHIWRAREGLS